MSFFRHREIFRSDVIRSVRRCESFEQIARQHSNWKTFALGTRYKRSASTPDTLTVLPENAAMGRHIIFRAFSGSGQSAAPWLIVSMSFQLVIPRRVALLQRSPPLRQPEAILQYRPAVGQELFSQRLTVS